MNQPKEIFVRLDRCMGCHSCELACAVEHSQSGSLYGAIGEDLSPKSRLYVEAAEEKPVPILCRHCEDAPCMHACIAGAISQEGSIVKTDTDRCIGCWTCVMVCPYGVIGRHLEEQHAYRCDRCPDKEQPSCVEACPTKALVFTTVDEFSADTRTRASQEILSGQGG